MKTIGLILAGGRSRRFDGKDKAWLQLNKQPLIHYIITAMRSITDDILISANNSIDRYAELGYPVVSDLSGRFDGPLHGIFSAMEYLHENQLVEASDRLLIAPCDMPALDGKCLQRLITANNSNQNIRVAHDGSRLQPLVALMPLQFRPALQSWIDSGNRKVEDWIHAMVPEIVDFSEQHHCFENINQPADLERISRET